MKSRHTRRTAISFIAATTALLATVGTHAKLRDAMARALAMPAVVARLNELGVEARAIAPNEWTAFGQNEIKRWAEAVRRSGAQVD